MNLIETRVLSILLVAGNVNLHEFNTLCNADGLDKQARQRALDFLREQDIVRDEALRAAGEMWYRSDLDQKVMLSQDEVLVSGKMGTNTTKKVADEILLW